MPKPNFSIDNYQEIYARLAVSNPNTALQKLTFWAFQAVLNPTVHIDDEARRDIRNYRENKYLFIVASNHVSNYDPPVLAGASYKDEDLRFLSDGVAVAGHSGLFKHRLTRPFIEAMGTVPVFRTKDMPDTDRITRHDAGNAMLETMNAKLNRGIHVAIFPEGTRNRGDPTKLQKFKAGIGRIACKATKDGVNAIILPTSIRYETTHDNRQRHRGATVRFGVPITSDGQNDEGFYLPPQTNKVVAVAIQELLDMSD